MEFSPETKKYQRNFLVAMLVYSVSVFVFGWIFNQLEDSPLRFVAILIPVVPTLLALYFQIRLFGSLDELQRRISAESWAISGLLVGFFSFTYGFLEVAGLPEFNTFFFFPMLIAGWGLVQIILRRRYL